MNTTIKTFGGLIDKPLEEWFQSFFRDSLGIENYYSTPGQIELQQLDSSAPVGHHLEIDAVAIIHKTCILFEFTGQAGNFRAKIKKFTRNAHLFHNSQLPMAEKLKLFGITPEKFDEFEVIENWKFVYVGTHDLFEEKKYYRNDFPDYGFIKDRLYILYPSQIEYLRQLTNLIGFFSKNELLAYLEFSPTELGDEEENFQLPFIKAEDKYITADIEIKADVYLMKFKVEQLLKIARVSRYDGIPFSLEGFGPTENYQRLLIPGKLSNIAQQFISDQKKKTFPNTITIALSAECKETPDGKLIIPKKYSSIDVIDGQHRLYAYTQPEVSEDVRKKSEILASAIIFRTNDPSLAIRSAAKVFCEINSTQAQVKKDLLYLIKYDVLGDRDIIATAGKVILECDKKGTLQNIFSVSSLRRRNKLGMPPIRVVDLIDGEIIPMLGGESPENDRCSEEDFVKIFGNSREHFALNPDHHFSCTVRVLGQYFTFVNSVFAKDWTPNSDTILLTESYFTAMLRLLRHYLFAMRNSLDDMRRILEDLKRSVDSITQRENPDSPSFPNGNPHIPSENNEINAIFQFLLNHSEQKAPE